ncbi:MAG: bifunctional precorrin-2 dehydrogenase/sirohydrochlorin ferrochelatase [Methanolinea sp.]|jgi:precorrin-2 dehydrogenase/sirohydrochlorin ferrochelatase|nr:bifunctional precorrin-2 dehydrogenase/sirohydrochlorin ferrochelatase [Methanolinea sp.]
MIPLLVDVSGKTVVIFGGGEVGARKAAYFAPDAKVVVYSRSFSPGFSGLRVECRETNLSMADEKGLHALLDGVFLAIAATPDRDLNNRIGELCHEKGILFNNADGESGDLLIPSVMKGERFLLAISTHGSSPAVSRFLREFLEGALPDLDRMIGLQERLRAYLKECQPDPQKRRDIVWKVLKDQDVWLALREGEIAAWPLITRRYLQ